MMRRATLLLLGAFTTAAATDQSIRAKHLGSEGVHRQLQLDGRIRTVRANSLRQTPASLRTARSLPSLVLPPFTHVSSATPVLTAKACAGCGG